MVGIFKAYNIIKVCITNIMCSIIEKKKKKNEKPVAFEFNNMLVV